MLVMCNMSDTSMVVKIMLKMSNACYAKENIN